MRLLKFGTLSVNEAEEGKLQFDIRHFEFSTESHDQGVQPHRAMILAIVDHIKENILEINDDR